MSPSARRRHIGWKRTPDGKGLDLSSTPSAGPLVVSEVNPRYFAVAGRDDGTVVYLTGSHIWNNFHDGLGVGPACAGEPEVNDYGAYLRFLTERGHNFIRLWRWEHVRSQAAG